METEDVQYTLLEYKNILFKQCSFVMPGGVFLVHKPTSLDHIVHNVVLQFTLQMVILFLYCFLFNYFSDVENTNFKSQTKGYEIYQDMKGRTYVTDIKCSKNIKESKHIKEIKDGKYIGDKSISSRFMFIP